MVTPVVLGPKQLPVITDPEQARCSPELAVLSALTHGGVHARSREVLDAFLAAMRALAATDRSRAEVYHDVVRAALPAAAQSYLEGLMDLKNYQFRSEFAVHYISRGKAEGEAWAVLGVLAARGIDVPEYARNEITGCANLDLLDTWVSRAVTVTSIDDLFSE